MKERTILKAKTIFLVHLQKFIGVLLNMITVVLGGQIGSEGKGKIAAYLASEHEVSIRTGGPNAGHTVNLNGNKYIVQLMPCAFVNEKCLLAMGAGSLINPEILLSEIDRLNIPKDRLIVDPQAGIIEERHIQFEAEMLKNRLSTGSGVGSATVEKIMRKPDFRLAKDIKEFQPYLANVSEIANEYLDKGKRIMIEGTQGFDLSVHHGSYPYVTSRDTTAATFCGEAGLSPRFVDEIVLVLRTYPIHSSNGPLHEEITWDDVTMLANSKNKIQETTSVTKKIRRVGKFDEDLVERAVRINRPTQLAINFVDYIDSSDYKVNKYAQLSNKSKKFIEDLERKYGTPVTLLGTGPGQDDLIDLRTEKLKTYHEHIS
ncbi:adenylosuccinate synthetase [Cohnella algarum]|uniref:adenylosuccinate synthetase n=1 Tax=Cohnella algarum TaxID=2044859 RepID=UPI0019677911|nr:adenylosuccinate synthetase [Cohnella algarum]MBN2984755.1 adenylosuccinate synthetase [Cohnella algarum]